MKNHQPPFRSTSLRTLTLVVMVALLATRSAQEGIVIPGLYNTGVDDSGNVLPFGSIDPHYSLTGLGSVAYAVAAYTTPGAWTMIPAPAGSSWIGPDASSSWPNSPDGLYTYTISFTFDLTGLDISKVQIAGLWSTDNSGQISLNGQDTGISKALNEITGGLTIDPFLIGSGFVSGYNTLEFNIMNFNPALGGNPTGLLVAGLTAADDGSLTVPIPPDPTVVPEPSTIIAGALRLLPFGMQGIRYLRNRKQVV
jgi:hypothetical protein